MKRGALKRSGALTRSAPLKRKTPSDTSAKKAQAARARKTVRAIRKLKESALAANAQLSAWEETFLGEGEQGLPPRLLLYGRAYRRSDLADPGDQGAPLSRRQTTKVSEIARDIARRTQRCNQR